MKNRTLKNIFTTSLLIILSGCLGTNYVQNTGNSRSGSNNLAGTNKAYIYPDNPIILTGRTTRRAQFEGFMVPEFITANTSLVDECIFSQSIASISGDTFTLESQIDECSTVLNDNDPNTSVLTTSTQDWNFSSDTDEFYQVNTYYHTKLAKQRFLDALAFTQDHVHFKSNMTIPPATKHNLGTTRSFWLTDLGGSSQLKTFSECVLDYQAFFAPALDTLCYGVLDENNFRMVQDPSVIYHEMGHVFVKVWMNQRNITSENTFTAHPYESTLGSMFYDEANATNEAIADYFSYVMNQRTAVGEFAINFRVGKSRPLEESESSHSAPISTTSGERLSYPQFLYYDPLDPETTVEDKHNGGAPVSHYLVALTKEFKNSCTFSTTTDQDQIHKEATNYVLLLLAETLAEIGDLTGTGSDFLSFDATGNNNLQDVFFTNLNNEASFLWTHQVNPPNFRRFFQILGKNIIHYISTDLCPAFTIDDSEKLLDDFGFLLFKSYENKGNGINKTNFTSQSYALYTNTKVSSSEFANRTVLFDCLLHPNFPSCTLNNRVNENNRRNSVLISKDFLEIDNDSPGLVVDKQGAMAKLLSGLTFEGNNVLTSQGLAGTEYNNNNFNISPGEVIGLHIKLKNTSNSVMGGVQLLANDWDHMKLNDKTHTYTNRNSNINNITSGGIATHSPCIYENFPSDSEGGVTDSTGTQGDCSFVTKHNESVDITEVANSIVLPKYDLDSPQPVCIVQFSDNNDTKWVSQDFYRKNELGLEDNDCLNNPSMSGDSFNPNECLIRFLPGGNQSVFGKIDPQKNWFDTRFTDEIPEDQRDLDSQSILILEVNKWVNPGTTFTCRLRTRFSNCSDCYDEITPSLSSTVEDFADYEHAGDKPFKVLNFQFTVLE